MVIDSVKGHKSIQQIVQSEKNLKKKNEPLLTVDGSGFNREKVAPAQNVIKTLKAKHENDPDDFYGRLKNMYNKPLTSLSNKKKNPSSCKAGNEGNVAMGSSVYSPNSIDSFTTKIKKYLSKMPKETIEKPRSSSSSEERVRYKRNQTDNIDCKTSHYEDPISRFNLDSEKVKSVFGGMDEGTKEAPKVQSLDDNFPQLENLPDDPEQLEKVFEMYTKQVESMVGSLGPRFRVPTEAGTEESVDSCSYRLDNMDEVPNPKNAVVGVRKCTCTDSVVIDGDVMTLKDIKESVRELKANHNVGTVEVRMTEGRHSVNEKIRQSNQLRNYTGPALLTRYALEKVCLQISKHPCLDKLVFRYVPMSSPLQAILVPAYANLSTLRLVGVGLKDSGVGRLCHFLWRSEHLTVLDFTDNGITSRGVAKIVKLIEKKGFFKSMQTESVALERLTLNKNPIGKEGCMILMNVLEYDLYMKAVDMRDCDIELSAQEVLDHVGSNLDLNVFDLRGNRVERLDIVIKSILQNSPIEKTKYKWDDEHEIRRYM